MQIEICYHMAAAALMRYSRDEHATEMYVGQEGEVVVVAWERRVIRIVRNVE